MNADNVIVLNGRLAKDIEFKQAGQTTLAKFTIAVNRSRKEQDGSRIADFHDCIAWGKTGELINQYFSKGSMIGIVGELQDNNYTNSEGQKIYRKQIVVDSFGFRESKSSNNQSQSNPFTTPQNNLGQPDWGQPDWEKIEGQPVDIPNDDLPF